MQTLSLPTDFYDCRIIGHAKINKISESTPSCVTEQSQWLQICTDIFNIPSNCIPHIDFQKRNVFIIQKRTLYSENDQLGLRSCYIANKTTCVVKCFMFTPPKAILQQKQKVAVLFLSMPKSFSLLPGLPHKSESFDSCDSIVQEAKHDLQIAEIGLINPSSSLTDVQKKHLQLKYVKCKERLLLSVEEAIERAAGPNLQEAIKPIDHATIERRKKLGLIA